MEAAIISRLIQHKIMKLHFLTNPNPLLQEKMRFFADYFSYANEFLGKLPDLPFDNPQSLIDKIIFQIETNIKRCDLYVENHFNQLLAFYKLPYLVKSPAFQQFEADFLIFKNEEKKIDWLKQNPQFLINLKKLQKEYEDLFESIFYSLFKLIICSHPLKKHQEQIKFYAQIIVSLFRLAGHSKESVESYVDRIISNDKFPFPYEIREQPDKESYNKATKEFLDNRDFKKQFEGLKNLMVNAKLLSGSFFYSLQHCKLNKLLKKDFLIKFDKVTFISPWHSSLKKIRQDIRKDDKHNYTKIFPKFFRKDNLLAYTTLNYESIDAVKDEAVKIIDGELSQLNEYLATSLSLNTNNRLFLKDFDKDIWRATVGLEKTKLSRIDNNNYNVAKENAYEILRGINSEAKEIILFSESGFIKAFAEDDISNYWFYVENLFWSQNISNEKIRKRFTQILLKQITDFNNSLLFHIALLFHWHYHSEMKKIIDENDAKTIFHEIAEKNNFQFDLMALKEKIKNPFVKYIIKFQQNLNSPASREKWRLFFSNLLIELYEYRNSKVHSGKTNMYSQIKLTAVLPSVLNKARWSLINACKENESLSFEELINDIIK